MKVMFLGHFLIATPLTKITVSSESLAKDELICNKNFRKINASKNPVNSKPFSIFKSSLNDQHNLSSNFYIGSGLKTPQKSYLVKSILTQSEISLIWL